jgi:hypothetical protein
MDLLWTHYGPLMNPLRTPMVRPPYVVYVCMCVCVSARVWTEKEVQVYYSCDCLHCRRQFFLEAKQHGVHVEHVMSGAGSRNMVCCIYGPPIGPL